MAMFQAIGDESYFHSVESTPFYVVAGYLGTTDSWAHFESLWRESMHELKIERIGLHASACEAGRGDYNGMPESRRRDMEYRLIVDIAASGVWAVGAAIEMAAYRNHAPTFDRFLGGKYKKYNKPYLLAVRNWVASLGLVTEHLKSREPIAFVLDRNGEFWRRAEEWYHLDINNEEVEYRHRLGAFAQDSRMNAVGLQAADLFAFSWMRHLTNRPPWHWKELSEGTTPKPILTVANEGFHFDSGDVK